MRQRYWSLSIFLILLTWGKTLFDREVALNIDPNIAETFEAMNDPETLLTFGKRIPFSQAGISELELIPRISDKLAIRIVDQRKEVVSRARNPLVKKKKKTKRNSSKPPHIIHSFEVVKGIGPKTSTKIKKYIDPLR